MIVLGGQKLCLAIYHVSSHIFSNFASLSRKMCRLTSLSQRWKLDTALSYSRDARKKQGTTSSDESINSMIYWNFGRDKYERLQNCRIVVGRGLERLEEKRFPALKPTWRVFTWRSFENSVCLIVWCCLLWHEGKMFTVDQLVSGICLIVWILC